MGDEKLSSCALPEDESPKFLHLTLWIALSSNLVTCWITWPHGIAVDYAVFWETLNRHSEIYAPAFQPFVYPPTALIWFEPLRIVGFWPGFIIWSMASLVFFWVTAAKLYGSKTTALATLSPAVLMGLIPGQTSLLAAAGLFAAYASPPLLRGVILGSVFTFKPQLVALAPLFLIIDRQLTTLVAMALAVMFLVLLAILAFGFPIWTEWLSALPGFQQLIADRGYSLSAASPAAFAPLIGLPRLPVELLGFAVAIWIAFRSRGAPPELTVASIATASLLAAPYSLKYYFVAIAPLMSATILATRQTSALAGCIAYTATLGPMCLAAAAYVTNGWREA